MESYSAILQHAKQPVPGSQLINENVPDEGIKFIKKEPDTRQLWGFHTCDWCFYQTKSYYAMNKHLTRHKVTKKSKIFNCMGSTVEGYRCNTCKYTTSYVVNFNKHMDEIHHRISLNHLNTESGQPSETGMTSVPWKSLLKSYACERCSFKSFSQLLYVVHCRRCPVNDFLKKRYKGRKSCNDTLPDKFRPDNESMEHIRPLPPPPVPKIIGDKPGLSKNKRKFFQSESSEDSVSYDYAITHVQPLSPPPIPRPQKKSKSIKQKPKTIRNELFVNSESDERDVPSLESSTSSHAIKIRDERGRNVMLYVCKFCKFSSGHVVTYANHLNSDHGIVPTWLKCEVCDYKTIFPLSLTSHKSSMRHHNIQCTMCDYKAGSHKLLKEHAQKEHILSESVSEKLPESTVTKFKCEMCTFKTNKDEDLCQHILNTHVSEEQVVCYKCQICTYRTIDMNELEQHVLDKHVDTQHNEWFPCEMCTYKFKQRLDLKKHIFAKHIM